MTLLPEQIGDKGQRYVVIALGYPKDGKNNIAYTNDQPGALKMLRAIQKAPGCIGGHVLDRETGNAIIHAATKSGQRKTPQQR